MNAIPSFPNPNATPRRDGWTPDLRARFLALLAEHGNVRVCAARCERSAQSTYVQRRRDPVFAQGWDAAMLLARDHAEQVLAHRALEGVEEIIFYRGEEVGSRRRYDSRLLLAHLARLDRIAQSAAARAGAARFDEIVAVVAGEALPEMVEADPHGPWPRPRADFVRDAVIAARDVAFAALYDADEDEESDSEYGVDDDVDEDVEAEALEAADEAAEPAAEAAWDDWIDRAHSRVDQVLADRVRDGDAGEGYAGEGGGDPASEFKSLDGVNRVNFAPGWGADDRSAAAVSRVAAIPRVTVVPAQAEGRLQPYP